jgi:transposase
MATNDWMMGPEEFIHAVLDMYYQRGWTVQDIAERFEVGIEVINRVLDQYGSDGIKKKPQKAIEDKRPKKKLLIDEIDDVARKALDKITKEDFEDLKLDIELFGRGHEPEQ